MYYNYCENYAADQLIFPAKQIGKFYNLQHNIRLYYQYVKWKILEDNRKK